MRKNDSTLYKGIDKGGKPPPPQVFSWVIINLALNFFFFIVLIKITNYNEKNTVSSSK